MFPSAGHWINIHRLMRTHSYAHGSWLIGLHQNIYYFCCDSRVIRESTPTPSKLAASTLRVRIRHASVCIFVEWVYFFLLVFGSTYVVRLCLFYLDSNCSTYFCSVFFFWTDNLLSCLFSFRHNQLVGRYIFNVIAPMHRRRWLLDRATAWM